MSDRAPSIFLIAGEPSGDLLGASLMAVLRREAPAIRFCGIGGETMREHGLTSQFPMEDISAIGFMPVLRKFPLLVRRMNEAVRNILAEKPSALVLIDSPDFTLRVAARVRRANPDIPIIKLVSPTVWAWRPGRAKAMKPYVDEVLALFPFEPEVMARLGGPYCTYIGHPMIERMDELAPSPEETMRRMADPPVILALPGSRASEIKRLAPVFGEALAHVSEAMGVLDVRVPTIPAKLEMMRAAVSTWPVAASVIPDHDGRMQAFRQARAAMAASGTVTLELAMSGLPMVAAYKVSKIEQKVMEQLVLTRYVSLPNIILGEGVVPELLQEAAHPKALADMLIRLIRLDDPLRLAQTAAFERLHQIMGVGQLEPASLAARRILSHIKQ